VARHFPGITKNITVKTSIITYFCVCLLLFNFLLYTNSMRLVRNPSYEHEPKAIAFFRKYKDNFFYKDHAQYDHTTIVSTMFLIASRKEYGLKRKHLLWLSKQAFERNLAITQLQEDYLPVMKSYVLNERKLKPLNEYKDIGELADAVEGLGDDVDVLKEEDYGIIADKDGWILAMPHTTSASQKLGKATKWCTARVKSQNLFLSYVGRKNQDIILFYLIKMNGNTRENPNDKLSVGFINGEPDLSKTDNYVTVNAANDGLSQQDFVKILGERLWNFMLKKMMEKSESIKGKHPAKKEMERMAKSINLLTEKLATFKNEDEFESFKEEIANYDPSDEIIELFSIDPSPRIRAKIAGMKLSDKFLERFADDNHDFPKKILAANQNINVETQMKLADEGIDICENLARNKSLQESMKIKLISKRDVDINTILAMREDNSEKIQEKLLSRGYVHSTLYALSKNKTTSESVLNKIFDLAKDRVVTYILEKLADSKFNSIHIKLFNMKNQDVDYGLSYGPYVSKEIKDAVMKRFETEYQ